MKRKSKPFAWATRDKGLRKERMKWRRRPVGPTVWGLDGAGRPWQCGDFARLLKRECLAILGRDLRPGEIRRIPKAKPRYTDAQLDAIAEKVRRA